MTGIGVWLKVRDLQTPAFTGQAQARAELAAGSALSQTYGITPQRIQQFQAIAQRFRT